MSRPRFGRFQILDSLTLGGMAEILLAREEQAHGLERVVVIKRLLPHLEDNEDFKRMFLQEARVIAGLNHPNIVRIHELGQHDGQSFIAMEYLAGSDLKTLWRAAAKTGEPLPLPVVVSILMQAAAGAHAAHELVDSHGRPLGLVHRDISPPNLMIDTGGHVKLLDFGIAKATEMLDVTQAGVLKGKVAYMSPEQVATDPLDRRSDVFALGIILWEMVTGHRLFARNDQIASLRAISSGEVPSPKQYRPDCPDDLVQVIHWALAHNREDRIASAAELERALGHVADRHGWNVRPQTVATYVQQVLGDEHEARRGEVLALMEPTLGGRDGDTVAEREPAKNGYGWLAAVAGSVMALIAVGSLVGAALVMWWLTPGQTVYTGEPLVIAHPPTIEPERLEADLAPLRQYLEARLERPVRFEVDDSYDKTAERLISGDVAFASLTPYLYVQAHQREPDVQALVIKRVEGSSSSDSVVLVHEEADIASPKDLFGRTICYSDTSSTTGYLLPRKWLREQGLDPDSDLVPHISGNHGAVLNDLNNRVCDVGGTFSNNLITAPSRRGISVSRLRTFAIAGRSPHDAICAGPAADPDDAALLTDLLLKFVPSEVNDAAALEEITSFAPVGDAYLNLEAAAAEEAAHQSP